MFKKILLSLIGLVVLMVAAVAAYMSVPFPYQEQVGHSAYQSSDRVQVIHNDFISFIPDDQTSTGVIFYPGGKTHVDTFAPVMRQLTESDVATFMVPMPLNTAFLGINKADEVMAANPQISRWYLIGHSLGGVAAAQYAKENSHKLVGLILWAAYPASDISYIDLPVLSIAASHDLQSTQAKVANNMKYLPDNSHFSEIQRGNHWQYGYFDDSQNQQQDLISRQEQIRQVVELTSQFIRQ
ncbi:alpha/beta hydrolase [Paraferrimonas sp. SM1919]|uniref:alpha/beta hydrolase n=1 Tax=Paraferrimonas sp. SM1919 TaxID=2662263 RepID=UPI0013D4C72D|nr:alpha/beta hydrolase [Paraferrimonas sp. SM1919]